MKINEDFDREYDQDEYEHKVAKLVTKADKRIRKSSLDDYDKWWAVIRFLQQEDLSIVKTLCNRRINNLAKGSMSEVRVIFLP